MVWSDGESVPALSVPEKNWAMSQEVLCPGLTAIYYISFYPVCSQPHIPSSPTQRHLELVDGEGAGAFQGLDKAYQTHRGEWEVGEQPQDMADLYYSLGERCRLQEEEVEHREVRFNLIGECRGTSKLVACKHLLRMQWYAHHRHCRMG